MGSVSGKNTGSSNSNSACSYTRRAQKAGSWYESNPRALHQSLDKYLANAAQNMQANKANALLRAVIVPHAGYSYSGPTAAYSYHALKQALASSQPPIEHILVLHPAHHVYLKGCAVSGASVLETPLGSLQVDDELRREILDLSSDVTVMDASTDEDEHSGELQYPYLAKLLLHDNKKKLSNDSIRVLPIMCGALSSSQEATFGALLSDIIARPNVVCVISSDFCHWGSRFRFQPTPNGSNISMPIHDYIQQMDHQGMDLIALQQPGAFADYLKRTSNTICGRHAISVWLRAIEAIREKEGGHTDLTVEFVKYAQSSAVTSMNDSSVSYASAVVTAPQGT